MSLRSLRLLPLLAFIVFPNGPSPVDEPIELKLEPYAGPLRTLTADVGGKTAKMMFDSGGGSTVFSPRLAAAARSTVFGRGTGFRHDGSRIDGRRGTAVALRFGSFTRNDEVGVLDLDAMLRGLPPLDGIVSLETFAGRALTVDLARDRLTIETPASLSSRIRAMKELRVRIAHQAGGASLDLFVAIEGRHGPLWFELDSGNTQGVLLAPHSLTELGLAEKPVGATLDVSLPIRGLGQVRCKASVKELIYDGLLDFGFLQRHVVSLDLANGRGWAAAN